MKLQLVFTFLFASIFSVGYAQVNRPLLLNQSDLIIRKGGKYIYEEKGFNFDELGHIIESDTEAFDIYTKAVRKQRSSRNTLYAFFITAGLSAGAILLHDYGTNGSDPNYFFLATGAILGTVSLVLILPLYLIQIPLTWGFKRKSITTFNQNRILDKGFNKETGNISLRLANKGIGIIYSF